MFREEYYIDVKVFTQKKILVMYHQKISMQEADTNNLPLHLASKCGCKVSALPTSKSNISYNKRICREFNWHQKVTLPR